MAGPVTVGLWSLPLEVTTGALFTNHDKDSRTVWRTTNSLPACEVRVGPDGKDKGWSVLGGLEAGEDIGVGALMGEEEFARALEKNIPGRGHSL